MKILAISGSLRKGSSNTSLIQIIRDMDPDSIEIYSEIESFPFFSPEKNEGALPKSVLNFKEKINSSDGLIISTPEYAFGMPGVLKNALDWLVYTGELYGKPIIAMSASPSIDGGEKALSGLLSVLTAQGAVFSKETWKAFPKIYTRISKTGEWMDETIKDELRFLLINLKRIIKDRHAP